MTPQLRKLGKGMPIIIALLYFLHLELVFSLLPLSMMAVILIGCTIAFLLYTRLFPHFHPRPVLAPLLPLDDRCAALIVAHPL